MGGIGRPPVALVMLSGWRKGLECLGNQSHPAGQAGGPGAEGAGGECGCVDEIRNEGSAVVAAAEAVALRGRGCGTSGGQGAGPGPS